MKNRRISSFRMEKLTELLLLTLLVVFVPVPIAIGKGGGVEERFLLQRKEQVMKTEAGEFSVVRGFLKGMKGRPMDIGFINMEPGSLLLPQYMDSTQTIFVRKGDARIGWIYKGDLVEKELGIGDLYVIPAGSTFYIANIGEGQRLQLLTSINKEEESLGSEPFQSFFIGGGWSNPTSVFAGFGSKTMATALNVSTSKLEEMLSTMGSGAIVHANVTKKKLSSSLFASSKVVEEEDEDEEEEMGRWTWRKFFNFGSKCKNENEKKKKKKRVDYPDVYNLYKRKPDFENKYGSTWSVYATDYAPLHTPDVGVYLVNLRAASMLAPHLNPRATEMGIVLRGSGVVQIVYPNGSTAMNAEVTEGDVFWVPRYYPFCQIASRDGPFAFFGFTTSSQDNQPQFLVGASSILSAMNTPELAAAFGISRKWLDRLVKSQSHSAILPAPPASPPPPSPPLMDQGSEVVMKSFLANV